MWAAMGRTLTTLTALLLAISMTACDSGPAGAPPEPPPPGSPPGAPGLVWTARTGVHRAVTYGGGLFVAVGDNGSIRTSPDGADWTPRPSGTNNDLYAVVHGNGRFVAVGFGRTLTSADGVSWSEGDGYANLYAVTYANNLFVAVGQNECCLDRLTLLLTSPDGSNWQSHASELGGLYDVVHANGLFMAVGDRLYTSADGRAWAERATPAPLSKLAFGPQQLVALGQTGAYGGYPAIFTSP